MNGAGPLRERLLGAAGYPLEVRVWPAAAPLGTVVMLHGVVSHARWLDPIAARLAARGIVAVCPDRRGSGANPLARGDAPSAEALLEDLDRVLERYGAPGAGVHLCGYCWGAVYAVHYLASRPSAARSAILLAPGLFPSPVVAEAALVTGSSGEAVLEPEIPLEAFTSGPALEEFVRPDPLRLRRVSPRFNSIRQELSRNIILRAARLPVPTLMVLAESDRLTDNRLARSVYARMVARPKRLSWVSGAHGLQFDAPEETASRVADWIVALELKLTPPAPVPRP